MSNPRVFVEKIDWTDAKEVLAKGQGEITISLRSKREDEIRSARRLLEQGAVPFELTEIKYEALLTSGGDYAFTAKFAYTKDAKHTKLAQVAFGLSDKVEELLKRVLVTTKCQTGFDADVRAEPSGNQFIPNVVIAPKYGINGRHLNALMNILHQLVGNNQFLNTLQLTRITDTDAKFKTDDNEVLRCPTRAKKLASMVSYHGDTLVTDIFAAWNMTSPVQEKKALGQHP